MIDDSALFHAKAYDPVKAHEYYLRRRKLKGRTPGSNAAASPKRTGTSLETTIGGKPNRANTKSRQAQLRAQKEALEKRLDRLREVLEELVEAAKKRSGAKDPPKDAAPETKVDKADRNAAEKKDKPLTAKQKSDKAKQAKEAYEKEHPNTLSQDVDILKEQVQDIQAKIAKALTDARERSSKAGKAGDKPSAETLVRPSTLTSGPRGR